MGLLDRAISFVLPAVPRPIVRAFSRRYIAGSTIDDAFRVIGELSRQGAMATVDILGEFVTDPKEARVNTEAYIDLVRRIGDRHASETNASVKLTALGLLLNRELCLNNMRRLLTQVQAADSFVRIDMEDSACTTATLEIYRTLRKEFPGRTGVVLQACLRRTLQDVDDLSDETTNFRICKGIYVEPMEIAFTDADLIRRNFTLALDRMLKRGAYVGIATHDETLIQDALRLIRKYGLSPERYEFQMLLGVAAPLRRTLIDSGHRMRVYVPYGQNWYAYSVRRLRENPQIAGYVLRGLFERQ